MTDLGILVVGHGTRDSAGQMQMRNLACQTAGCLAPLRTELGFLELAEPSIHQGVASLARQGVKRLVVAPVLLFRAGHADRDIPDAVRLAAEEFNVEVIAQTPPLEQQATVLALSAERFQQALEKELGTGVPNSAQTISLAMIARGSSSDSAAAAMEEFARLRCQLTPVQNFAVGYVAVRKPNVEQTLDWLGSQPSEVLVVQPHLLFEGEVFHGLVKAVESRRAADGRKWIVCDPLGAAADRFEDDRLARVFKEIVFATAGL